ncbi:outer membrane beta-barrel protein [Flammeovirga agarivorans]|uniref:Outer membrane beta-barrel protein n=1 Tax=Flammeovirga agarivorans TaxID=2726742 RepID=A0A7X8XU06_9BACT|nr:outer membrane beta-barrel protein [Flammeovirga agarivorans]NLR89645.1 outer membrane beta-barrel protein [Flammeovirga agarivorans]
MKKCLSKTILLLLFLTSTYTLKAQHKFVFGICAGLNTAINGKLTAHSNVGLQGGFEIGDHLNDNTLLTLSLKGSSLNTRDDDYNYWSFTSIMGKYRYILTKEKKVHPYLFIGAGAVNINRPRHHDNEAIDNIWNLGIQAGPGIDIGIFTTYIQYQYSGKAEMWGTMIPLHTLSFVFGVYL